MTEHSFVPCRSFVVVPPIGARFDDPLFQMRIEDELNVEFFGFQFVISTQGSDRFKEFMLIPMLGKAGDNVTEALAAYPDMETIAEIATFLARYELDAPSRLH
ncbi:hypothetical protein [Mesorhizobium ciceri]|uniref:hypothetical protein n=1 Tax=Mesorhizobium ciceri TaxID=39645 RepID=UPI00047BE515|nr:hypothetical protein [Mesorhizobium ciceri]